MSSLLINEHCIVLYIVLQCFAALGRKAVVPWSMPTCAYLLSFWSHSAYIRCNSDTSLTLTNVRRSQRGFYQCFATNQVGTAHASISLNVLTAPTHFISGMLHASLLVPLYHLTEPSVSFRPNRGVMGCDTVVYRSWVESSAFSVSVSSTPTCVLSHCTVHTDLAL